MSQSDPKTPSGRSTENPLAQTLAVSVSVPETINVRMVQADVLDEYEAWLFLASLFFSAATGFVVAFVQTAVDAEGAADFEHLWFGIILLIGFAFCARLAFKKRQTMRSRQKIVAFQATREASDR